MFFLYAVQKKHDQFLKTDFFGNGSVKLVLAI